MRPRDWLASETVFLTATAAGAAVVCGLAFARLGFLGLSLVALVALVIAYRVEIEADGPTAGPATPEFYARLHRREPGEHEGLRRRAERAALSRSLRFVRLGAAALLVVGAVGFFTVQL